MAQSELTQDYIQDPADYIFNLVAECPNCPSCAKLAKEYLELKDTYMGSEQPKYPE